MEEIITNYLKDNLYDNLNDAVKHEADLTIADISGVTKSLVFKYLDIIIYITLYYRDNQLSLLCDRVSIGDIDYVVSIYKNDFKIECNLDLSNLPEEIHNFVIHVYKDCLRAHSLSPIYSEKVLAMAMDFKRQRQNFLEKHGK